MHQHGKLNYVEFASRDLAATKAFFGNAFDWQFTDYGDDYTAFSNEGLDGGFFKSDKVATPASGAPLLVFYSAELENTQVAVEAAGAEISQAIFSFPGGRRFHFVEPGGNEFAVWSE